MKGHPSTFSCDSARRFLKEEGFIVAHEEIEDYEQVRNKNCQSRVIQACRKFSIPASARRMRRLWVQRKQ